MVFIKKNFIYFRFYILLFIIVVSTLTTNVEATNPRDMLNDPSINASTPGYDIIRYSLDQNITYEEGVQRFKLINKTGDLEVKLMHDNPNTFAGLWIEHQPRFKIVVQFAGNPNKTISNYVTQELQDVIEVRKAEASLVSLKKLQSEVLSLIDKKEKIPVGSSLNVQKNRVELYVTQENYLKTAKFIQDIGLNFSRKVTVIKAQVLTTH